MDTSGHMGLTGRLHEPTALPTASKATSLLTEPRWCPISLRPGPWLRMGGQPQATLLEGEEVVKTGQTAELGTQEGPWGAATRSELPVPERAVWVEGERTGCGSEWPVLVPEWQH